jgi:hypothetical protein
MAAPIAQLPVVELSSFFALPSPEVKYRPECNDSTRLILQWRNCSVKEGSLKIAA